MLTEIRAFEPTDAAAASFMVMAAFHAAVAPHYPQGGVDAFTAYADALPLARRPRAGHRTWVVHEDGEILGLVELRLPAHVAMLFVAPAAQRRGLGRRLLDHAAAFVASQEPRPDEITVHASPNAVAFYERSGFIASGPEREKDGVRFTPMRGPLQAFENRR